MKKSLIMLVLFVLSATVIHGQNLVPPIKTSEFTLQMSGYSQALWSNGGYVIPRSDYLETVHYPRVPYHVFGNGIQVEAKLGNEWTLIGDVTGQTTVKFYDKTVFQKPEMSVWLSKSFTEHLAVSATAEIAQSLQFFGVDWDYKPIDRLHIKGALYVGGDGGWYNGGYVFLGYKLLNHIELHTQIDYRVSPRDGNDAIWTNGVRIWSWKDRVELTADYESVFSGRGAESTLFARLQIRF